MMITHAVLEDWAERLDAAAAATDRGENGNVIVVLTALAEEIRAVEEES